jgi:hypothetical protein
MPECRPAKSATNPTEGSQGKAATKNCTFVHWTERQKGYRQCYQNNHKVFTAKNLRSSELWASEKILPPGGQALCRRFFMGMLNRSSRSQRLPRVRLAWVRMAVQLAATG